MSKSIRKKLSAQEIENKVELIKKYLDNGRNLWSINYFRVMGNKEISKDLKDEMEKFNDKVISLLDYMFSSLDLGNHNTTISKLIDLLNVLFQYNLTFTKKSTTEKAKNQFGLAYVTITDIFH